MSWRDKLQSASYKGVPFGIKASEHEFGRRTELKQLPNNDGPVLQDFGEDASEFEIDAFIISNTENDFDYMPTRDALIAAFKQLKAGTLVHPYYGSLEVYPLGRAKVEESIEEGGMAKITMRFVRVNEAQQELILPSSRKQSPNVTLEAAPVEAGDFNSLIDKAIADADKAVFDFFGSVFSTARSFADKMEENIIGSLKKIQKVIFRIKGGISTLTAEVSGNITSILLSIDGVIDSPCDLVTALINASRNIASACGVGTAMIFGGSSGVCSGISRGEVTELNGETIPAALGISAITEGIVAEEDLDETDLGYIPSSQLNNIIICTDLMKYGILSSIMQIAIRTSFLNQEDLIVYANKIADAMDDFLIRLGAEKDESEYEYGSSNEDFIDNVLLYNSVEELRNIFIQSMYAKAAIVSKKTEYNVPPEILSTLQLAYNKYEDVERETEIYEMNRLSIRHPGFLPSGGVISILDE